MHIQDISIKNIYSFEDSHFRFNKYNVIVGANNVGKTNLVRVLKLVSANSLNEINLPKRIKFDSGKISQLSFTLHFSDEETRMILQTLFQKTINTKEFPESLKIVKVIINWDDLVSENPRPINVIYHFHRSHL